MKCVNSVALVHVVAAGWLSMVALSPAAGAETQQTSWRPDGLVEFVVGSGPGGENDRLARSIQHVLTETHLVDNVIVLNKPGAGQIIAMNYLAGKAGDATKIGLVSGSFVSSDARRGSTLYKQLIPLEKVVDSYQCYVTGADSKYKTMKDVADRLREAPGSVTFAVPVGVGSPGHISAVKLAKALGAPPNKLVTVVFTSGTDVAVQAIGNHIDVGVISLGSGLPLIQSGKLRLLGIAAPEREDGDAAKYPTVREQGLDVIADNPFTVVLPGGLSPEQIAFWKDALNKVVAHPDFRRDVQREAWTLRPLRYPQTVKWMQDEYDENRAVLKELGLAQ
ncbi:MAG: Bug family tripartite tricarboxylate transporter substrate binding protein [Pseudolabrys sp.]